MKPRHAAANSAPVYGASLRPLWGIEDGLRFLNHGAFGATPKEILEEQQRWRDRLEADPPRFFTQELPGLMRSAAADLAGFLGTAPERLAFVENATSGVNAVLLSLSFAPGDEILATNHVYPGIRNTLRHVARRAQARLVEAVMPRPILDDAAILEAIGDRLNERTRLLVIDHVASASATRFPVAAIAALCRDHGVRLLIDGAHAPGMAELDIDAIGADWYVGNCHKWLCAPKGAGFLVSRRGSDEEIHPAVISNNYGAGFPLEFDYVGTRDPSAWLSVPAAIEFHQRLGGTELRGRNRSLAREVARLVASEVEGELSAAPDHFEAMIAIRLREGGEASRTQAKRIQALLSREHRIEVGMTLLDDSLHLRLSVFAYNEIDDYRGLGEVLSGLLERSRDSSG
jgi:isopenicillin-N epimerase